MAEEAPRESRLAAKSLPKHPEYATLETRTKTYRSWPENSPITSTELAEAGFFYAGYGDCVRCFSCGGGLRNWEKGDSAWVEHARWFPQCGYVLVNKGNAFILGVRSGEIKSHADSPVGQQEVETAATLIRSHRADRDMLSSIAAQSCLEMGFKPEDIKCAIQHLVSQGNTEYQGIDIAELLLDSEEKEKDNSSLPKTAKRAAESLSDGEEEDLDKASLLEENKRLKATSLCKVCKDTAANIVFLPCGHMIACVLCAQALTKCPVCRGQIKGTVRFYTS